MVDRIEIYLKKNKDSKLALLEEKRGKVEMKAEVDEEGKTEAISARNALSSQKTIIKN